MQTTTSSTISWTESFLKTLLWINWNFLIPTGKSSFAKIINHMNKHQWWHYTDVIMGAIASPITSLTILYSTVYSDADQREHQSSASLAFVRGIHRGRHHGIHKRLWATTSKHLTFNDKCINVKIKGISQNWLNWLSITAYTYEYIVKKIVRISTQWKTWWRHQMETFPRYWPFVRGFHRSPVNSTHNGQWRGALMFSLICAWTSSWANNRDVGDLRRHRARYDIIKRSTYWSRPLGPLLLKWINFNPSKDIFVCILNIRNVNCAREAAFIFDSWT